MEEMGEAWRRRGMGKGRARRRRRGMEENGLLGDTGPSCNLGTVRPWAETPPLPGHGRWMETVPLQVGAMTVHTMGDLQ